MRATKPEALDVAFLKERSRIAGRRRSTDDG
jgi:hypothetical protein